jgi:hypothetical protein
MSDDDSRDFYDQLGFEETDMEDYVTAMLFEYDQEGAYVLITDEEGKAPDSLRQPVIFSCYRPDGAFLWSTSFKNSFLFKDLWTEAQTSAEKVAAVQKYRESKEYY